MRPFCHLPALCLPLLLAASALAQSVYGLATLVSQPGVQKELKLTEKQADQAKKVAQAVTAKYQDELNQLKTLQGAELFKKQGELTKKIAEESNTALSGVLSAAQFQRLKQIRTQQRGIYAFSEPDVAAALNLSKDQTKKLRAVEKDYQTALLDASKLADAAAKAQAANTANKDALAKALDILDDTQKKAWKDLTGDPYRGK